MIRRITPRAIAETLVFWSLVLGALEPIITPRGAVFLFYVGMGKITADLSWDSKAVNFLLGDLFGDAGVEALQRAAHERIERMEDEDPQGAAEQRAKYENAFQRKFKNSAAEERAAYEDWYAHKERKFKY